MLRPYTPIRPILPEEEDGTFDLLVKTYLPSDGGPFPPGGTVSNYLDCMEEGVLSYRRQNALVVCAHFVNNPKARRSTSGDPEEISCTQAMECSRSTTSNITLTRCVSVGGARPLELLAH